MSVKFFQQSATKKQELASDKVAEATTEIVKDTNKTLSTMSQTVSTLTKSLETKVDVTEEYRDNFDVIMNKILETKEKVADLEVAVEGLADQGPREAPTKKV